MKQATYQSIYTVVKYVIYSLLAANIYVFFRHATFHEGLDCLGWLLLLAVFEWETGFAGATTPARKYLLLALELLAYSLIFYALAHYYMDESWLDLANALTWLALVASIEWDLHRKSEAQPAWHRILKVVLYTALLLIAALWGITGDALNFYDALMWILCFFCIELNLLRHLMTGGAGKPGE